MSSATPRRSARCRAPVETNQKAISDLQATDQELEGKIAKLSETAQDALERAKEAGKLAKGKFLYEVTLTDNDVKFGFNKYNLSDEAKAALDQFANNLKGENQNVYIEIQGHTDNIGTEKLQPRARLPPGRERHAVPGHGAGHRPQPDECHLLRRVQAHR